jgi:hypothetical protein
MLCGSVPSRSTFADPIDLTIQNALPFERTEEPITCGVPLARGFCRDASELALLGPADEPVPAQILVTNRYKDGSPRWVLLDFDVGLPPSGNSVYRLTAKATPAPTTATLAYRLADGVAAIDTGTAQFRIDTKRFRLFDSVQVDSAAVFEDAGPRRVVLAVRGRLGPRRGKLPLARYVCRMQFYAGKSQVRVFFTLCNPAAHHHPGNVWDLGTGGSVFMEDFSVCLPLAVQKAWSCRVGVEADRSPIDGAADTPMKLYQDSSGGENWQSANHVDKDYQVRTSFRGYRVHAGNQQVHEGGRADGWLTVRTGRGLAGAAVRDFWQNFPKALDYGDGVLRLALWPGEFAGVHELLGGEQKTHEILFVFGGSNVSVETVGRRLTAFQRPLYAMPDPAAVVASGAFWVTAPIDRRKHGAMEATCDTFVDPRGGRPDTVRTMWERIDEYGWRHFGDTFADNEGAPAGAVRDHPDHHFGRQPISHYGNEYDVNYTVMLQGLRRGDPNWMWMADVMSRHYADVCIYHTDAERSRAYAHGPFTHTTHDTAAYRSTHRMYPGEGPKYGITYQSGGPNAGHCYVSHLIQHYYLTGDRNSLEAFLEVAEQWCLNGTWLGTLGTGDRRGLGNFFATFVYAYQLTHDRRYYDAALEIVALARPLPPGQYQGLAATLFVKAGSRFLDVKRERDEMDADYRTVLRKMLEFGDHYLEIQPKHYERHLAGHCGAAQLLFLCYLYAPGDHPTREAYYAKGKQIMDEAAPKWPGRYMTCKNLVMCFSNSGAYYRAEQVRALAGESQKTPR